MIRCTHGKYAAHCPQCAGERIAKMADAVKVGQWRVWPLGVAGKDGKVFRVTDVPHLGGFRIYYPHAPEDFEARIGAHCKTLDSLAAARLLTTSLEVLEAFVASLPEDQRKRVTWREGHFGMLFVDVDGEIEADDTRGIDAMLAAVREALAKLPTPAEAMHAATTAHESVVAMPGCEPNATAAELRDRLHDAQEDVRKLRAQLTEVTRERDELIAVLDMERETQWWATYRAALTGHLARYQHEPEDAHRSSVTCADLAHGERKAVTRG